LRLADRLSVQYAGNYAARSACALPKTADPPGEPGGHRVALYGRTGIPTLRTGLSTASSTRILQCALTGQITIGGRTQPRRLLVELGSLRAFESGNRRSNAQLGNQRAPLYSPLPEVLRLPLTRRTARRLPHQPSHHLFCRRSALCQGNRTAPAQGGRVRRRRYRYLPIWQPGPGRAAQGQRE
jgi:hypothetical protein